MASDFFGYSQLENHSEFLQMTQEEKLLGLLKEHESLGIANQIDYQKFYLYSLITHSTAIEGSTVTEMNHLQYEFGLVPVKIVKEDKGEYIQALVDSREQDSLEPFRAFMLEEHIRNISREIAEYKRSQHNDPIKTFADPINAFADPIKQRLYQAVIQDGSLNYAGYAALIGISEATVKRRLNELKKEGFIVRIGSKKTGHWEISANIFVNI